MRVGACRLEDIESESRGPTQDCSPTRPTDPGHFLNFLFQTTGVLGRNLRDISKKQSILTGILHK